MSKPRTGLYLGLAAAGAGGYYLYRAGGNPQAAKEEVKHDASKARQKIPRGQEAEKAGEMVGKEANLHIDEAVENARSQAKLDERIPEAAQDGIKKIDNIRHDAAKKLNTSVDKLDRQIEEKASEAKSSLSGWFGGKK